MGGDPEADGDPNLSAPSQPQIAGHSLQFSQEVADDLMLQFNVPVASPLSDLIKHTQFHTSYKIH